MMFRDIQIIQDALLGDKQTRREHRTLVGRLPDIRLSLKHLPAPGGQDDKERPVFILSAGWRSGSTLLQRLILSDKETLIWGEPYAHCGLIPKLADSLLAFNESWPPQAYFVDGDAQRDLARTWTANLYPDRQHLWTAHREFFMKLFAEPAYSAGYARWGIKEVRLDASHAAYLQWLFPSAQFIFLVRNPYSAWRSYRARGCRWYAGWPFNPVFTPRAFGSHWHKLASDFIAAAKEGMGHLVYYESMEDQTIDLDCLEKYLGVAIDRSILKRRVGASRVESTQVLWAPKVELMLLRRAVSPLDQELGYRS